MTNSMTDRQAEREGRLSKSQDRLSWLSFLLRVRRRGAIGERLVLTRMSVWM
jgi:hypothetical protein